MFYPKISQRFLALFVLCFLLLALGALGIIYLLSFVQTTATAAITNKMGTERYDILLPQHVGLAQSELGMASVNKEQIAATMDRTWNDNNSNESEDSAKSKETRFSQEEHEVFNAEMHKLHYDDYNNNGLSPRYEQKLLKQAEDSDFELEDMEQPNIYIDEFDKPNTEITDSTEYEKLKHANDDGSEYFTNTDDISSESMSMDDKTEIEVAVNAATLGPILEQNVQLPKYKKMLPVPYRQFNSAKLQQEEQEQQQQENVEEDNRNNNNDENNKKQRLQLHHGKRIKDNAGNHNDNDDEDLENFSGSGNKPNDETGYDDETANFIQRISLKMKQNFKRVNGGDGSGGDNSGGVGGSFQPNLKLKAAHQRKATENEHIKRNHWKPAAADHQPARNKSKKLRKLEKMLKENGAGAFAATNPMPFANKNSASINSIIDTPISKWPEYNDNIGSPQRLIKMVSHATPQKNYNSDLQQSQQTQQQLQQKQHSAHMSSSLTPAWLETRTRRIIGNVEKSEERSRQLLLCEKEESGGGGELCRMLFKHLND